MDDIASSCPACGAQLIIPANARQITCSFCGTRFTADLSGVQPVLKIASASTEMPDVPPIPEPAPLPRPEAPEFPQFVPAQPRPEAPKAGGFFTSERIPPAIRRQPIWAIIAIIFAVLLCLVFGCMAAVFALTRVIIGG